MAHQVFISYAIEDKSIADAVCKALEQGEVRCWYAPRDVPYAVDYEEAIVDAISESKLMLLVLSSHSNDSKHVKREVQNASREEPQVPVLPFQIEDVALNKSLKYYIGSVHWLSALTPPLEDHLEKLVGYVQQRLPQAHDPVSVTASTEERAKTRVEEDKEVIPAVVRDIKAEDDVSPKSKSSQRAQPLEDHSAAPLPENKAQRWMRWMRVVEIGSFVVLFACVLAWFEVLPISTYVLARAIIPVFVGLLTVPLVAIAIKTKVASEARRAKLFFIISGLTILGIYALRLAGTGIFPRRIHYFILFVCLSIFIFAVFNFVRSTTVPTRPWRSMVHVVIIGIVVPAVFALALAFVVPDSINNFLTISLAVLVIVVIVFARRTPAPQNLKLVASLSAVACAAVLLGIRVEDEFITGLQRTSGTFIIPGTEPSSTPTLTFSPLVTAKDNDVRGREFFSQQKYADAEPYYREAVRLEPGNAVYNNNLGDTLFQQQKYSQAETYYNEAVRLAPDSALMHNNLGLSLEFQRKYVQAEIEYRAAVRLEPSNAGYNNNLGDALRKQEKYLQAEPYYREAVRLDPDNAYKRNNLGLSLEFQQKYLEAESEYREAVRLEATNASYNNNLGDALYKQRKYAQAEPYYREAVRLEPNNSVYQENLKKIKAVTTSN